jgi:hypothetical protein
MAPVIVQTPAQNTSTTASCTVTLGSPTTTGNCLVVVTCTSNSTTNASVSGITLGGAADNFGSLFVQGTGGGFAIVSFWADPSCAGGQNSVVVTTTGGSGTALTFNVTVYEVSGLLATLGTLLDRSTGVDQSTGSLSWSSGSTATTTQASELWVGGVNAGNTSTITGPASPWVTAAQQLNGAPNNDPSMAGYQIASATGAAVYSGSQTASKGYEAAVITLFAAATVVPPAPPVFPRPSNRVVTVPFFSGPAGTQNSR